MHPDRTCAFPMREMNSSAPVLGGSIDVPATDTHRSHGLRPLRSSPNRHTDSHVIIPDICQL